MDTVAIYCRLSDEDKNKLSKGDDSESIQNQKMLLTEYAINQGWHIYKIFSDDDYSGLDKNRPQFNQMIREAQAGKFNIILCKTQSRFTRDMELVEKYLHGRFPEWGIRFVSIVDNVDTSIKGNKKARQIYGLINEWYCEDLSDSIRAVFRSKMENGQFLGSFACFGYMKDPADRHRLIVDEKAADIVRMIFDLYMSGYGTWQIRNRLNELGIPTPTRYKQEQGLKYKNCKPMSYNLWSHGSVIRILKNQTYIGNLVQGVETTPSYKSKKRIVRPKDEWIIIENHHEPIIDKETFYAVQSAMNAGRREGKKEKRAHIFAGKVKCMDCGSTMMKCVNHPSDDDYKYTYLRCKKAMLSKKRECSLHTIKLEELAKAVKERLRGIISAFLCNDGNCEEIKEMLDDNNGFEVKLELKRRELERLEDMERENGEILKNLYADKVRGVITEAHYLELYDKFIKDSGGLKRKKALILQEIEYISGKSKGYDSWIEAVKHFKGIEELTHDMVGQLVDYIEIGEKGEDGRQEIGIHWQF